MADDDIAMFEFAQTTEGVGIYSEKHYKLMPPKRCYGRRPARISEM